MQRYLNIAFFAFLIAAFLTPIIRALAFRLGILDHPKAHGIHTKPVPRMGGLAIYIAFVIGSLYLMDLSEMLKGVLVASSLIFAIGLMDDWIHLRASVKLAGQLIACGIMMFKYGVILQLFQNIFLDAFFTILGVIGLTNAVNFLDNMDGLAAGLVMISSFTIAVVAESTHQAWLIYLSMSLAGAAAGFLLFNLRKAYVFMGDAGSTFLGFTLASLAVMCEWSYHWSVTMAAPILILGVPILDMILITVLRIKEDKVRNFKEWIDYAGKDHLSHRFMRLGLGKRGAVFFLWGIQALFGLLALFIMPRGLGWGIFALGIFGIVTAAVILFFRKKRSIVLRVNGRKPRKRSAHERRSAPSAPERSEVMS